MTMICCICLEELTGHATISASCDTCKVSAVCKGCFPTYHKHYGCICSICNKKMNIQLFKPKMYLYLFKRIIIRYVLIEVILAFLLSFVLNPWFFVVFFTETYTRILLPLIPQGYGREGLMKQITTTLIRFISCLISMYLASHVYFIRNSITEYVEDLF